MRMRVFRPAPATQRHECERCGRCFSTLPAFRRHVRAHDEQLHFRCVACPARFETLDELVRHRAVHRAPGDAFVCNQCSKKLATAKKLVAHKLAHTTQERSAHFATLNERIAAAATDSGPLVASDMPKAPLMASTSPKKKRKNNKKKKTKEKKTKKTKEISASPVCPPCGVAEEEAAG